MNQVERTATLVCLVGTVACQTGQLSQSAPDPAEQLREDAATPSPDAAGGGDASPTEGGRKPNAPVLRLLGSAGADYTKAAAWSPTGELGVTLVASGPMTLDAAGTTLPPTEGADIAVITYDIGTGRASRYFRAGGSGTQVPHGLVFDADGSAVVIGYTRPSGAPVVNLDPSKSPANDIAYSGGEKPFVARYSPSGALVWARLFDHPTASTALDRAWDVALDARGDVYVVGTFRGSLALDETRVLESNAGSVDLFVAKLAAKNGSVSWGFQVGGPEGDGGPEGAPVAPGGTGDAAITVSGDAVFVQGEMRGTVSFGGTAPPGPANTRTSAGGVDLFVARYSQATGALQSLSQIGGPSDESAVAGAVRTDRAGNVYIAGRYSGELSLGGQRLQHDGPGTSMFIASLSFDLAPRWAKSIVSDGGLDGIHRLEVDARGALYATGWYGGAATFGPNSTLRSNTVGPVASDIFLARLDSSSGVLRWVANVAGTSRHESNQIAAALAIDGSGDPWIGGQIFVPTTFGGTSGLALSPVGLNDAFVARFDAESGGLR
jgi:hypothetical protein